MESHTPPGMELTLRTLAMPADANAAGDIFGGWAMSQMDLAAAVRANERCNGRTVTGEATACELCRGKERRARAAVGGC